jgi:hypothetical protein
MKTRIVSALITAWVLLAVAITGGIVVPLILAQLGVLP